MSERLACACGHGFTDHDRMGCLREDCSCKFAAVSQPDEPTLCEKAPHDGPSGGYLHATDDDSPYEVDGVWYCGRCHFAVNQQTRKCQFHRAQV